ncbi:ZIP family metal transporter [Moheibacter lacus]|uniref:ZIP family metal transporter n=1 Tax=Moheibacter lacus TaxID=2745851 RepID=A0A838ZS38_9FLAO|nr:ZIP family metal transporter [Moheibacter lacus]MBA5629892.1 ZIP family metal transporter [Moheibacter lacus]
MFEILILFLSVGLGSLLGQLFVKNKSLSKFLLIFSGAFFLATAVLEIFPTVYEVHDHSIGLYVLGGLFFQMIVESLSKGAEHGHVHLNHNKTFPISIFIGLFLHSFFEGMPIMHQHSHNLLWAIFIHNIPVAMVLYGAVSQMKIKKIYQLLFMFVFALAGPLGVVFGETVLADYHVEASAFVAGIFIHIATVILFESTDSHKFKTQKVLTVLLGFVVAYLTISGHQH